MQPRNPVAAVSGPGINQNDDVLPMKAYTFPRPWAKASTLPALVLALVLCLLAVPALAEELELNGLVLDNEAGNIFVRFGVRVTGYAALAEELDAGSSVALTCEASVHRHRSLWTDKRLAEARFTSLLSKDMLADEYVLTLPGQDAPLRGKHLPTLLREAWGSLAMDLGPWKGLPQGNDYRLGLTISMDRTDVPVWLRYVVFFWSFDVYPPVSYQLEFTY